MANRTLGAVLEELRNRNEALATAYRSVSRRTLTRSITTFAASASDQRKELGVALAELSATLDQDLLGANGDLPPSSPETAPEEAATSNDPAFLLRYFRDVENGDRELFAAIAGMRGLDGDQAARFAAFSEEARKRSSIAGGHLDLISLA